MKYRLHILAIMLVFQQLLLPFDSQLLAQPFKDTLPNAVRNCLPTAVTVMVVDDNGNYKGHGSGFFLTADGEVVTNHHVVKNNSIKNLRVRDYHGGEYRVERIIASSVEQDIAILKVSAKNVVAATFANSDSLVIGQRIFIIHTPAYLVLESTVTSGIVSQIRDKNGIRTLQFDVSISPGSSGGPIFDTDGLVVGLVKANVPLAPDNRPAQNINFGIPGNLVPLIRKQGKDSIAIQDTTQKAVAWRKVILELDSAFNIVYSKSITNNLGLDAFYERATTYVRSYAQRAVNRFGRKTSQAQSCFDAISHSVLVSKDPLRAKQAIMVLDSAIDSDTSKFILGALYWLQSDTGQAKSSFASLSSFANVLSKITLNEFFSLWFLGFHDFPKTLLDSIPVAPKNDATRFLVSTSSDDSSLSDFLKTLSALDESQDVLELKAMIQYKLRRFALCADTYRKLMSISPLSPSFHRNLAICNYKLDNISIAREELLISWQLEKNSEIEFLFAVLMLKESRPEITFEILDKISISGNEPLKSLALGAASVWLGNKTVALKAYDDLRKTKSRFAELLLPMIY